MSVTIRARPRDFCFTPSATAVVMIDMQRDFIEPGGFGETLGNDVSRPGRLLDQQPVVARVVGLAHRGP